MALYDPKISDDVRPPLVTVYITNHNYGRFLEQAIESILNQTMQDFELIIIDDGSTDNSQKIIERYTQHAKVLTVFQMKKGLNVSNNIALRQARGKYIMRLDADDFLDEHALMVLSDVLERDDQVGLVFPDYYLVNESGEVKEVVRRHDFKQVTLLDQPAHGACTMIQRECLLALGGYDESFSCQDGYDLWIRFIEHYQVQNVNLPLFYYRQHRKSLTRNEERILETRAQIIKKHAARNGGHLKTLAIIPARGRSLDPGSLALRPLGGHALIDWTLQSALQSSRISDVLVTTPDEEILAHVGENYGDKVWKVKRDSKLALPNTYIEDTLMHAIENYTRSSSAPDVIMVLYAESPFRTSKHMDSALDIIEIFDVDTIVTVQPDTSIFYKHKGKGLELLRQSETLRLEREELYREVGHMHVVRRQFLEKRRKVTGGKVGHIILDKRAALELNTDDDWEIAEFLIKKHNLKPSSDIDLIKTRA